MEKSYEFTLVVFAGNVTDLYNTFQSVKTQRQVGNVHIVVVKTEAENDNFFSEQDSREKWDKIINDSDISVIDATVKDNVVDDIKATVKGKMVSFVKAGVVPDKSLLKNVRNAFVKNHHDVVATKSRGKQNIYTKEHNNYGMRFTEDTTLDNNPYMIHQIYSAYYFETSKLEWVDGISMQTWALDVIRMVFINVMKCQSFGYVNESCTDLVTGKIAVQEWIELFDTQDGLDLFVEKFFVKMLEYQKSKTIKYPVNSNYVMLFYCVKIGTALSKLENVEEDRAERYEKLIDDFLKQMKHKQLIISNQHINKVNKRYLLMKYFSEVKKGYSHLSDVILNEEYDKVSVKIFELTQEGIHFEFSVLSPVDRSYDVCMLTGKEEFECEQKYDLGTVGWCRTIIANEKAYTVDIPYKSIKDYIAWGVKRDGEIRKILNVNYGKYVPFTKKVSLYIKVNDSLMYLSDDEIVVKVDDEERTIGKRYEILVSPYDAKLEKKLIKERNASLRENGKAGYKAIIARKMYERKKAKLDKNVWLISDRTTRGDDNGEVMFRYMCANPDPAVEPYFVIEKGTTDYNEMKKLGKVVSPFSWKHKLLFLLNEFSLSSQANKPVINPFGRLEFLYRDLMYDKKLVFLQHGVTKDNQSKWLNKYNRNLFGFVVSTKPEYDSVFEYDYFYSEKHVWLTGMPRYDRLVHDEKKYVTIMPTWRKSLSAGTDEKGIWQLGEEFVNSEYFKFYNALLNNKKLLDAAQRLGYKICFMPHPNTIAGIGLFDHDERVLFMDTSFSYKDVFAQTDLMVTDYSSVAFDFAYLRKPIVYSQFDKEEFFNGEHSYTEGYFDYERDGFGEVEYTLETVVDRIIEYMDNGCRLKDKFKERTDNTFSFSDQECSKRVYEMIIKNR